MMSFTRLILILVSGVFFGMSPAVLAQENPDDSISAIADHMHEHLDQVNAIKAAVIAGRLEDVREPASWLANHEEPAALPSVAEMRRYAARAAAAEDLVTAAAAVSEIARSCGDCHQANGIKVAFGFGAPPTDEFDSVKTQMQRHLWAADRMWAGLIGPSDKAWQRGTQILAEVELVGSDISAASGQQTQIGKLVERAKAVGKQGNQAASVELRSGLYGEFLSLCATCHSLTGQGPEAAQ